MRFLKFISIIALTALLLCGCGTPSDTPDTDNTDTVQTTPPDTEPLPDISDFWDKEDYPQLIAHAGGSIYGYRLSNSLEAINNAYANGFRYIELDFQITSDGKYVLLHDWESMARRMLFSKGQLTHSEFLGAETFAGLTLLDLDMLTEWLSQHPNCRIVTDAKCENLPFLTNLSLLPDGMMHRFIPQTYSYEEYLAAKELGFEDIILTLYAMNSPRQEIIDFIRAEIPFALTIPETVLTEDLVRDISSVGVVVYTHTVNDLSTFEKWREFGLHGIYTDHFIPSKWVY